ncbi:MAG: HAMP domain-containing sensor histidine kinase [Actinomycetes bacterium]
MKTRQRISLRARLVITLLVLAMAGLVVSGLVINKQLSSYLTQRIDQQLVNGVEGLSSRLTGGRDSNSHPPGRFEPFPAGTYAAVFTRTGTLDTELQSGFAAGPGSDLAPKSTTITSRPDISAAQVVDLANTGGGFLTVGGSGDVSSYRVYMQPVGNAVIAVAIPLTDIDVTLTQLLLLEIAVGLGVLAMLGIVTYITIRAELQPLERMSQTAAQIADGDLSHRVDAGSGGTEVGRLGNALNTMLARIEEAFAAKEASEARLRRFVGDASHELRTPLTSIRGYAEMFHRGANASPEDLATLMRRIESESQRMSVLVDDLLLLARLDQQRPLRTDPMDLEPILVDVGLDIQAAHPDHVVTVSAQPGVWVTGDEDALRQVVVNLARNACVHTPPGTPVTMSLARQSSPVDRGDCAQIIVSDCGPGIPSALTSEVFERFTRADASRGRDAGGAGLGLSIVSAIVAAHGGTVHLTPTPGGGATFTVYIPLAPKPADALAHSASPQDHS